MTKEKLEQLVLNMVNFQIVFEKEFQELIPDIHNSDITPLLSRMLNEIHLQGRTTSSCLSKRLNLSVPNTSRGVNALYKLGYIVKSQDKSDKRIVYLTLSEKGFSLIQKWLMLYQDNFLRKLEILSDDEVEEAVSSFEIIRNIFIKIRDFKQ